MHSSFFLHKHKGQPNGAPKHTFKDSILRTESNS
jgi:hypothetical protein